MRFTVPFFDRHTEPAPLARTIVSQRLRYPAADPETQPLRILHIMRAPMGGLFRHVCDLAEEQTRMGHEVGIICDSKQGGEAAKLALGKLAPWCRLGVTRIRMNRAPGIGDVITLAKIGRHVSRLAPHIIHGHGAKGGAYARLLPRSKGRIALYTPHGGAMHYSWKTPQGAIFLALERALMLRSDGILFESHYSHRVYTAKVGMPTCPNRVVPNGLSQADFSALPKTAPVYDAVFVGELRMLKGLSTLIDAAAAISRDRPFRLGIAGTGPDEARFRAQAQARGVDAIIDFLGHKPAREVFAKGRTIVVPSLAESFPYIVLESIASGRPVIATHVGGIPEMFGPHADQLLAPGDAPALVAAIRTALEQPAAIRPKQESLQDRARKLYSAPRMARDITRFYKDLRGVGATYAEPRREPVKFPETTPV
jgi:glycosyltransferase involved in cell wall biosynthesis